MKVDWLWVRLLFVLMWVRMWLIGLIMVWLVGMKLLMWVNSMISVFWCI